MMFVLYGCYCSRGLLCIRDSYVGGFVFFFFQAEDGIRDLVRSRGLGDVYKRQVQFATSYASAPNCRICATGSMSTFSV